MAEKTSNLFPVIKCLQKEHSVWSEIQDVHPVKWRYTQENVDGLRSLGHSSGIVKQLAYEAYSVTLHFDEFTSSFIWVSIQSF